MEALLGKGVAVACGTRGEVRGLFRDLQGPSLTRACEFGCWTKEELVKLSSLQDQVYLLDKCACSHISAYQLDAI